MAHPEVQLATREDSYLGVTKAGSENADPIKAAQELYHVLSLCDPACIVFFCCPSYPLEILVDEFTRLFGDVNIIGCTSAGEITPLGYSEHSISAFALGNHLFSVETRLIEDLATFSAQNADTLVDETLEALRKKAVSNLPIEQHCFAFSLLGGLSVQEELVTNALNMSLNDIPLIGGSAGDDKHFVDTRVFYNGRCYSDAAVLMVVNTICDFEVFSHHHLQADNEKLVVTQVSPDLRVVHELNAEPAALEYCRINGLKLEDLNSRTFAMHPLAVQVGDQLYIRSIQKVNDDLSLTFFCAIDAGVVLTKMTSSGLLQHTPTIFSRLTDAVGEIQLLIGFDCIHRRIEVSERDIADEMSVMYSKHNVIGFNTYGEQINGLHLNHTFTGVAIGYARDRHYPTAVKG